MNTGQNPQDTSYREVALMEKIRSLPPERVHEVEDFVDFLQESIVTLTQLQEQIDILINYVGVGCLGSILANTVVKIWRNWAEFTDEKLFKVKGALNIEFKLDTEDKMVVNGNFVYALEAGKNSINYRISHTLIFGIKDYKFKIDLIPTGISTVVLPLMRVDQSSYKMLLLEEIMGKEEYIKTQQKAVAEKYSNMGYKESWVKGMVSNLDGKMDEFYASYLINYRTFQNKIKNIYSSIKDKVSTKEEW